MVTLDVIQLCRKQLKQHDEQYQLDYLKLSRTAFQAILQSQRDLLDRFDSAALHFTTTCLVSLSHGIVQVMPYVVFLINWFIEGLTATGRLIYKEAVSNPLFSHVMKRSVILLHTHVLCMKAILLKTDINLQGFI